jgi:hypothetical protein
MITKAQFLDKLRSLPLAALPDDALVRVYTTDGHYLGSVADVNHGALRHNGSEIEVRIELAQDAPGR